MRPLVILAALLCLFAVPVAVDAVKLTLDPAQVEYNRLDRFYVPVRVDTEGACINAVSVEIRYDPSELSVVDVSLQDSILTLFTERPAINRDLGLVRFSGGIPGGYCGRIGGDLGQTNLLGALVVTGVPKELPMGHRTDSTISFTQGTEALAHDGLGSKEPLTTVGTTFALIVSASEPVDSWLADVRSDVTAPELFDIELTREPALFNNRWFIVFNTTDKQSGVARYEVLETDPLNFGVLKWFPRPAYWVEATSPYMLKDQKLQSKILVRAVDQKGNERVVTYAPPEISVTTKILRIETFVISVGGVLILALLAYLVARSGRRRSVYVPARGTEDGTPETDTDVDTDAESPNP